MSGQQPLQETPPLTSKHWALVFIAHRGNCGNRGLVTDKKRVAFKWINALPCVLLISELQKEISRISLPVPNVRVSEFPEGLTGDRLHIYGLYRSLCQRPTCCP